MKLPTVMTELPRMTWLVLLAAGLCQGSAQASLLSLGTIEEYVFGVDGTLAVNLTDEGTRDWKNWGSETDAAGGFDARNEKATGTAIGQLNPLGGLTAVQESIGNWTVGSYTATDGVFGGPSGYQGVLRSDQTLVGGEGFSLVIDSDGTAQQAKLYLYLYDRNNNPSGQLNITLPNATPISQTLNTSKATTLHRDTLLVVPVNFTSDVAGDDLQINWTTAMTGSNPRIGVEAVTLSVIPEPGTLFLAALGFATLACTLKRR